jgi:N-acetylglucosaminyldiphosphoundecaprenol N-acetyl-beta-D-mannosaminyltransferase
VIGELVLSGHSAKEDRDYILEYKSMDLSNLRREELLDVPVDNVSRDEAVAAILDMIEKKNGPHHILFLDPLKLMRLRRSKKLGFISDQARMVLADGGGLEWAARKMGVNLKERIPMIAMIMDLVRLAAKKDLTIYLLGSRMEALERVFFNLQRSFPGVRIIGRQEGYFNKDREVLVKEALRKSSPDLIFLGLGFPLQEIWMRDNWQYLSNAVVIGVDGSFDVLSGKQKKAPDGVQLAGFAWLWRTLTRPFLVDRLFATIAFYVLVMWRAFRKKK